MKAIKYCSLVLVILLIFSVMTASANVNKKPTSSPIVDKEALLEGDGKIPVIIGFNGKVGENEIAMLRSNGASIKRVLGQINAVSVRLPPQAVRALEHNPNIKYVTENGKVHIVSDVGVSVQTLPWGVDRIDAERVHPTHRGAGIIVSITDTGIAYNHEDLLGRTVGGWDYVNNDADPMDDHGHGTHVAGTVAANNNTIGVIGVAPSASLFAMKMLDSAGSGWFDDATAAIIDSADMGADIISMSWGCSGSSACDDPTVRAAIQYAYAQGVLLVAAAGNVGGAPIGWPARYPEVMAITATDPSDAIAGFSSIGPEAELAAPGVDIPSTVPTGGCTLCSPTGYRALSGTSMATPHVSGTAALILSAYPSLTRDQLRSRLTSYAEDKGAPGRDPLYGYGIVNAYNSVFEVPPPPPPPEYYIISEPPYSWINGVAGGTRGPTGDDAAGGPYNIGFNFNFYGRIYSTVNFSTNGLITFDGRDTTFSNTPIPNTNPPNNFIAPYWDDLYADSPGATYYKLDTSTTPRRFIVTWDNVRRFGGTTRTSLEAVLYEDGRILYQYNQTSRFENPASATVGVEDIGAVRGQQFSYNQRINDYSAVLFTPRDLQPPGCDGPCINVSITPPTQSVLRGRPFTVNITVDPLQRFNVAGVQADLLFNGNNVSATGVVEGNFLRQGGATTFFNPGTINNPGGIIDNIYGAIITPGQSVSTRGNFAVITMTADRPGRTTINLGDVTVSDPGGNALPNRIIPGEVNIIACDAVWDVNRDGVTNIQDIVIVGQHFGERTSPPYPPYDVNADGIVNIQDIVIIGQHFGERTCWV